METEQFPGIDEPTSRDRLAAELADEQLRLIFGLRQIRIDRGMSITEVADAMGVDPAQVSRFESGGTNPTMATIRRYAKTVEALFRIDTCEWVDRAQSGRAGDIAHWGVGELQTRRFHSAIASAIASKPSFAITPDWDLLDSDVIDLQSWCVRPQLQSKSATSHA